jgi:hypothetical protein
MKHVFGVLTQIITMAISYVTVVIIVAFDSIIFGYPIMWINNTIVVTKFSTPELGYIDTVLLIFLFKLIAVLWKSVHMETEQNNMELLTEEETKQQQNG